MDTSKLIYRDDLSPRQNFETLFNWVRFMMEEFDHGRVSVDKVNIDGQHIDQNRADIDYLTMMTNNDTEVTNNGTQS